MVVQTDKGLGPGAIEPPEYFRLSIKYHLINAQTYQRLTPAAAAYHAKSVQNDLEKWTKTYLNVIIKEELKFFHMNLKLN